MEAARAHAGSDKCHTRPTHTHALLLHSLFLGSFRSTQKISSLREDTSSCNFLVCAMRALCAPQGTQRAQVGS